MNLFNRKLCYEEKNTNYFKDDFIEKYYENSNNATDLLNSNNENEGNVNNSDKENNFNVIFV